MTLLGGALSWSVVLLSRLNGELVNIETFPQLFVVAPLILLLLAALLVNLCNKKLRFSVISIGIALILASILSISPSLVSSYWPVYLSIHVLASSSLLIASIDQQNSVAKFSRLFILLSGFIVVIIIALEFDYPVFYSTGWIALLLAFVFTVFSGIHTLITSRK